MANYDPRSDWAEDMANLNQLADPEFQQILNERKGALIGLLGFQIPWGSFAYFVWNVQWFWEQGMQGSGANGFWIGLAILLTHLAILPLQFSIPIIAMRRRKVTKKWEEETFGLILFGLPIGLIWASLWLWTLPHVWMLLPWGEWSVNWWKIFPFGFGLIWIGGIPVLSIIRKLLSNLVNPEIDEGKDGDEGSESMMNGIEVIQSEAGKEIIVRVVHSRFNEDAWIGLFKAGSGDNEHGDRWKWMRDVDVSHITFPAQGAGEWSVRLFKDGGYDRISSLDFNIRYSGSSIEILEAVSGKPVRFRINNRPSSNDAWVGIYPVNAGDNEHGNRWKWIRDLDVNNSFLPEQYIGRWSIRVFLDGGYTLHDRVDFDIVLAQNPNMPGTMPGQHIHDSEKAAEFARALGLNVGGAGHPFVGDWQTKGFYAYRSGKYSGIAYFGSGGSEDERLAYPSESEKYRPWNRQDPKMPEDIRQKLIRLEDRSSTRTNQTSQPSSDPSDVDVTHCKPGPRLTYADSEVYAAKMGGRLLTLDEAKALMGGRPLYPGEDQWCAVQGRDWVQVGDLYHHPGKSHNRECGGYPPWGDDANNSTYGNPSWNYVALYKIHQNRKKSESTPFQTGWYRIENADGSLIERIRVHQDMNHQARNEFIATGDLTGDVKWYVEGNTVKVPKFGSTGTIQADENITWVDGGKAIYEGNSATRSEPILNSDGRKYVFAHEHKEWHWHNERARAMGGHIASITSAEENEQITRISGGAPVWIGGIRKGSGNGPGADHWYWDDGRPWSYTNWHSGEPNNHGGRENRVHLTHDRWNDVSDHWHGPAVYLVPLTASEDSGTSEPSPRSSPEIDILAQFKSKLEVSNSHLSRIEELSSKLKKK